MDIYPDNEVICEHGLGIFRNIAVTSKKNETIYLLLTIKKKLILWKCNNNNKDDTQVKAGKAGVIGVILLCINRHINNPQICKQGCSAFCNVMANRKSSLTKFI